MSSMPARAILAMSSGDNILHWCPTTEIAAGGDGRVPPVDCSFMTASVGAAERLLHTREHRRSILRSCPQSACGEQHVDDSSDDSELANPHADEQGREIHCVDLAELRVDLGEQASSPLDMREGQRSPEHSEKTTERPEFEGVAVPLR